MKNIFRILLCLAPVAMAVACADPGKNNSSLAIIEGVWNRGDAADVSLFRVVSGRLELLSTFGMQDDKKFSFAFTPAQEGFYVVGTGNALSGRKDKYTFYFKPGDHAGVEVNDSTYALAGHNTKENKALAAWHEYIQPLEEQAAYRFEKTYVDFFPLLEERNAGLYHAETTGNKIFDQSFAGYRQFDMLSLAFNFIMTPRQMHPTGADFNDFYRTITMDDVSATTSILSYPYGSRVLNGACYIIGLVQGVDMMSKMPEVIAAMKNDTIKGEMVIENMQFVRDYLVLEDILSRYGQYILTDDQKARVKNITVKVAELQNTSAVGKPAINFTHKDRNGKNVSLSDFKGKVVYVDIWATWCGPCRKEIPHLKELESKYHDKNVVFMSVSIDEAKDYEKWKEALDKEQLAGVQLFGGNGANSDVAKFYQVKNIPRFLLIDKDGNIASINAPRPSSPDLAILLDKLL